MPPARFRISSTAGRSAKLIDGRKFAALREYQALLDSEMPVFSRNLTNQLVVYATGAPVSFADRPAVEEILKRAGGTNPNLNELLHQVIQSPLFLKK